ncbi:PadR family transcriptional regulator [Cellulomonas cellasea]|uniref:PadR family transcriptional regulator PadR n=1 Tax=Cellulomonas cellasea TaxID=43670 RepID=A0A7W4UE90_9CELL|nr:PadR family transcriptional regulator [Cellulomonas cellasea]MBB2922588.1 PadR family transcriptional regulator PadR [Cellulomonas cellasea]
MPDSPRDPQLLKGVLPILVLALLTERESYGYELVTRLRSDGLTDITTGTVYPVLARLERDDLIASRLVASPAGPARKYYVPTAAGTTELGDAVAAWRGLVTTVDTVLTRALPGAPVLSKESS